MIIDNDERNKFLVEQYNRNRDIEDHISDINEIRNKRAKGEKVDTPYYIQVVKEELGNISNMFNFPK